jgi:hypothetical protein
MFCFDPTMVTRLSDGLLLERWESQGERDPWQYCQEPFQGLGCRVKAEANGSFQAIPPDIFLDGAPEA